MGGLFLALHMGKNKLEHGGLMSVGCLSRAGWDGMICTIDRPNCLLLEENPC